MATARLSSLAWAVLLWAFLLLLPTLSMGGVRNETHAPQNRLIGYTSPTTEATYTYDALDRGIAKTVDGVTEAFVCCARPAWQVTNGKPTDDVRTGCCAPRDSLRRTGRYKLGDHA